MRQFLICVTLAALVCGAALTASSRNLSSGSADTTSAAKDAVVKLENLWLENEGNPTVLDSILADDFVHVLPIGMITKKEHIDFVRQHPWPKMKEHRFEKLQVRRYGDVAIANGIVLAVPDNGAARRTYFTDVFVLRGGRWQAVNAQESEASSTVKP
ncbi:MAG TPA: nuclear transport factor 2 family protein [Candidatus Acidoferrales bacterium]|nr:nuclear transport factor 2 family protein [Candidatus Acidoferrales bacterium]HEV2340501.1 nuclear transport factor 2 family protein [Candidatus Acidoferrales bacterium]